MSRKNDLQIMKRQNVLPPVVNHEFLKEFNNKVISADLQKSCEMAEEIFDTAQVNEKTN